MQAAAYQFVFLHLMF